MARVTAKDVQGVIDADITGISMVPFIAAATSLVDEISSNDSGSLLNDDLLKEIERYLSAHFYSLRDPIYKSKKTGQSNANFMDRSYLEAAEMLDLTNYLKTRHKGTKASVAWLGLAPSGQTNYEDRD